MHNMIKSTFRYGCTMILVLLMWYTVDFIISNSNLRGQNTATRSTSTLCSSIPKPASMANHMIHHDDHAFHNDEFDYNERDSSSLMCQMIDSTIPFPYVWENKMKQQIMDVSLMGESDWNHDLRDQPNFVEWVQESLEYFTLDKLQHTQMSQPLHSQSTIQHIHTIIERKLQHRQNESIPPLQILIFGGSVTIGHECLENVFDFQVRKDGKDNGLKASANHEVKTCAWPGRLQEMFNAILGPNIIEITNMANGGAQTEMSTTVLQFGLLPNNVIPDIIIWDHGINDAIVPVTTTDTTTQIHPKTVDLVTDNIFQKLQAFYQAAINLPKKNDCCNSTETAAAGTTNQPPVIILLDTLLGHIDKFPFIVDSLTASAAVSKMTSWYPNVWGVSYANTIRSYVLSNLVQQRESLPLLGMKGLYTHPGMMYHITVAWTMAYNIMHALHNNCIMQSIQLEEEVRQHSRIEADRTSQDQTATHLSNTHELDVARIPELSNDLLLMDIPYQWNKRISESSSIEMNNATTLKKCRPQPLQSRSSLRCYHAWIANKLLHIDSPREIFEVINENMVQNRGWTSYHDDRKTSPGWVAEKGMNSYFELVFENVPVAIESLTIICMQSYSEKWYNSTLQIDSTFEEYDGGDDNEDEENGGARQPQRETSFNVSDTGETKASPSSIHSMRHVISGYHQERTSILVPLQLPLRSTTSSSVDDTSVVDDSNPESRSQNYRRLRLQFLLINGETFKIAGIAIC